MEQFGFTVIVGGLHYLPAVDTCFLLTNNLRRASAIIGIIYFITGVMYISYILCAPQYCAAFANSFFGILAIAMEWSFLTCNLAVCISSVVLVLTIYFSEHPFVLPFVYSVLINVVLSVLYTLFSVIQYASMKEKDKCVRGGSSVVYDVAGLHFHFLDIYFAIVVNSYALSLAYY